MSSPQDIRLTQKYPAKEHARKVISCLKSATVVSSSSPSTSSLSLSLSVGNDTGSGADGLTGILYVEGQKSQLLEDSDEPLPFRQRRQFYYLTGCELPDCYFTYDIESGRSTLLVPPVEAEDVMWQGLPMTAEEAKEKYEVDEVLTSNNINAHLASRNLNKTKVWAIKDQVSSDITFLPFDDTDFTRLKPAIDEARVRKTPYEIALLKHANKVSSAAHEALMSAIAPSSTQYHRKQQEYPPSNERELHALFLQQCITQGLPNQAYPAIIAGGVNAATLHYVKNDASLDGKLNVLIDAGAESSCYSADITRVIPLRNRSDSKKPDGKFSPESRAIYAIVLRMQEAAFAMMRSGVEWADIHAQTHRVLIRGLLDLGILRNGTEEELFDARTSVAFFPHGLGHLLGMDTHDTGGRPDFKDSDPMFKYLRLRRKLVKDCVVTVEPGCYFCRFIVEPALQDPVQAKFIDEKVLEGYWTVGGVRIEDNAVITEDGYVNLTTAPKQIADVERIVSGKSEPKLTGDGPQ